MNSLSRIARATNWKYALGEILLIFIGITLALTANSWYESRNDRAEENEILLQVVASLQLDISDLGETREEIEEKVRLMKGLEAHIDAGRGYSPELDLAFKEILTGSVAHMNTSAFETLKFRGIDIVSSPELRGQLVDYYDSEQARLERRNNYDRGDQSEAIPFFKKNFRWESEALLMTPLDYDSLVSDQEFRNILAVRIWAQENLALREYGRIEQKAGELVDAIEDHLGQ